MKNMLIHDVQLLGRSPDGLAQNTFDVPKGMATSHVIAWASAYAGLQKGLDNLFVMCHGYEQGIEDRMRRYRSMPWATDWLRAILG